MKSLILVRHAKSSWAESGTADYDRPLNDRGKRDAPQLGELLAKRGLHPDLIVSSSAKRARKTAKKMLAASGLDVELRLVDELYLAPPKKYANVLRQLPDTVNQVLAVGHNPGLEELVESLTGRQQQMPTAALAVIEIPIDSWSEFHTDLRGRLEWFWSPANEA